MSDFKLIKELGLEVHEYNYGHGGFEYIQPAALEALLAKGVRVGCRQNQVFNWNALSGANAPYEDDTHTGLLIGIMPIQKDSWEKFTKDIIASVYTRSELYERARKLLEGK